MQYLLSVTVTYDVGSQHDGREFRAYRRFTLKEENDTEAVIIARRFLEKYIKELGMRTDFSLKARLAKSGEPRRYNDIWHIKEGW